MTWLIWRQHRMQVGVAFAILAALSILLWVTGLDMSHSLRGCKASPTCSGGDIMNKYRAVTTIVNITVAVPLLFGIFWGTSLMAREFETSTHVLAWTQSISRRQWLNRKLLALLAATVLCSAGLSAIVTWWWGQTSNSNRFDGARFQIEGVTPIAYSIFAVALAAAAGAILRRSLATLGVTIFGFAAMQVLMNSYLRSHLVHPLTALTPLGPDNDIPGAWIIGRELLINGRATKGIVQLPAQCAGTKSRPDMNGCLSESGYQFATKYLPSSRYWTLQYLESGIYLALAVLLIATCVIVVRRRDA